MTDQARGPGRPPFQPTAEMAKMVETLAAFGVPQDAIAKTIGCTPPTMRKYFGDQLEVAATKANAKVAETLFKIATNPDHPKSAICCMFWLKTRARWAEAAPEAGPGKKETAATVAATAEKGTHWDALLN